MSSRNLPAERALANAIANGLTPGQESDLVNKVVDDLDQVFTAVFTGPLPPNDAVNLTNLQRSALPPKIAWTDLANVFDLTQTISTTTVDSQAWEIKGNYSMFRALFTTAATKPTRLESIGDGKTLLGSGIYFDGTGFHDDGGNNSGIVLNNGMAFEVIQYIAGVIGHFLRVESTGVTTLGILTSQVDLVANELGLKNSKFIRGTNAAATHNHPMIGLDANDLVLVGSNPTGFTTGEGNLRIPQAVVADLPTAGATRNNIIIIDKTNSRLCYYVNGLRYFIPIGTAF